MVVLVDERPEEVTDFERAVKGEVIASTFDRPPADHTIVAELAIERAKRLVELGHDASCCLDCLTRLGRAYNLAAPTGGRACPAGSMPRPCTAEGVLRCRSQPRARRLADDPGDGAGGDRFGHRRGHPRGVHRRREQRGAAPRRRGGGAGHSPPSTAGCPEPGVRTSCSGGEEHAVLEKLRRLLAAHPGQANEGSCSGSTRPRPTSSCSQVRASQVVRSARSPGGVAPGDL